MSVAKKAGAASKGKRGRPAKTATSTKKQKKIPDNNELTQAKAAVAQLAKEISKAQAVVVTVRNRSRAAAAKAQQTKTAAAKNAALSAKSKLEAARSALTELQAQLKKAKTNRKKSRVTGSIDLNKAASEKRLAIAQQKLNEQAQVDLETAIARFAKKWTRERQKIDAKKLSGFVKKEGAKFNQFVAKSQLKVKQIDGAEEAKSAKKTTAKKAKSTMMTGSGAPRKRGRPRKDSAEPSVQEQL